jgi:release factor glutamine methyltransferase
VSSSEAARAAEQLLRADAETLSAAQQLALGDARREIQLLLSRSADLDLSTLIAHPERVQPAHASQEYRDLFERRLKGEPIAYILNEREFYGRSFEVTPDVLIPRPETELLVDCAIEVLPERSERAVLDLGTGSGCIAITLAKIRREIRVLATDASKAALAIAARNVARHAAFNVELRAGTWFEPVADLRFDLIVSNPPYVAQNDAHLNQGDVRFEPRIALCAGDQGMSALAVIIAGASGYLTDGGWLMVEHGFDQSAAVTELMRSHGFRDVMPREDLSGIARVALGRLLVATP